MQRADAPWLFTLMRRDAFSASIAPSGASGFVSAFVKINRMELQMNGLIYLIGLIVVIMAVLSLLGLR
jgi:hypothetical protein